MALITPYLWLDLAITALAIVTYILLKDINYWKNRNVPYMTRVSYLSNILSIIIFQKSIGQYMERLHIESRKRNTGILGFWVFEKPSLFVSDPELIRKILIKDFAYFNERLVSTNAFHDKLGSSSVFGLKQPHWKNMRSRLSHLFSTTKVKQMSQIIKRNCDNMMKYIEEHNKVTGNQPLETKDVCSRYTVDNIVSSFVGLDGQCLKRLPGQKAVKLDDQIPQYQDMAYIILGPSHTRSWEMGSHFIVPEITKFFGFHFFSKKAGDFLKNIFWAAANLRRGSRMQEETLKEGEEKRTTDMLDLLMQFNDDKVEVDGMKYEGDALVAQFAVIFTAGFETSSSSMSLLLNALTRYPDVQDRLRKELAEVLAKHKEVTYDSLADMTYLDMAYKEILRLYPTLPFLDRICTKDYKVEGTSLTIEKGTKIFISLSGLQTDPRYWENPEIYDPERFASENKSKIISYTYIPFGEGPKICIGERFGIIQSKLGLARILSKYRVRTEPTDVTANTLGRVPLLTRGVVITPSIPLKMFFDYDPVC